MILAQGCEHDCSINSALHNIITPIVSGKDGAEWWALLFAFEGNHVLKTSVCLLHVPCAAGLTGQI